jgi:hypothetical protein
MFCRAAPAFLVDLHFRGAQLPESIAGIAGGVHQVAVTAAILINFRDFIGLPTRMIVAQLELRLFNQRGVILVVDFDRLVFDLSKTTSSALIFCCWLVTLTSPVKRIVSRSSLTTVCASIRV